MTGARTPTVLLILDGWGHSEETRYNAIAHANVPNFNRLWRNNPHTLISGCGMDVGLPHGQMGNSEVGHTNLGAGRVVYQDLTRISKAIVDGDFFTNAELVKAVDGAVKNGKAVHLFGLLSDGGVHSHEEHIQAMVKMAADRGAQEIYVHAFLDGRDTAPRSAEGYIRNLENVIATIGKGRIASLCGRYYAMDRDNNWARVSRAWELLAHGKPEFTAATAQEGLAAAYARDENDEFVAPTQIGAPAFVRDGDSIIFMNFRADRARQITRAFVVRDFDKFDRGVVPAIAAYVQLTEYAADIPAPVAYPPQSLDNVFGEYMAKLGKTQLRIAETEKYAHVTFFFNGGREEPFAGEDRILIPSPKVATFDLKPEMSAFEVTDKLVEAIESGKYDAIICNYANADQVGHTGLFDAAVKAVEAVDVCIGRVEAAVQKVRGEMLITADHGNVEQMFDEGSQQPLTAHTTDPVPLIYVGPRPVRLLAGGILADVAPTLLTLMNTPVPAEMQGRALVEFA
ncbi:MAG: 2,3-bisphosphoglycerate-independent phosphoglycerate mutase [Moraxellaceae bacterium]|nr:2,3-bisphosphoglycerate-independent phosphoglycerate mutase [Moraxellaceae bacterium]